MWTTVLWIVQRRNPTIHFWPCKESYDCKSAFGVVCDSKPFMVSYWVYHISFDTFVYFDFSGIVI